MIAYSTPRLRTVVRHGLLTALLALLAALAVTAHAQTSYTATPISGLGGSYTSVNGINASGQIVGGGRLAGDAAFHAALWNWNGSAYVATDLGTFGGSFSQANAINASSQIVGRSYPTGDAAYHATIWNWNGSAYVATDLGVLSGAASLYSEATAINASGLIVGRNTAGHAALWNWNGSAYVATDIGTLSGTSSYARDINASGLIVGYSYLTGDSNFHATLWNWNGSAYVATDIGTLASGTTSEANAINTSGLIVGYSSTGNPAANAPVHAALWNWNGSAYVATDLGTLGGSSSYAYDINASGQIVGSSNIAGDAISHAFLYSSGQMLDLNDYVTGLPVDYSLTYASISDAGQILAYGSNGTNGSYFVLTAVPEPSTYAAALAAVALCATVIRRRKAQAADNRNPA